MAIADLLTVRAASLLCRKSISRLLWGTWLTVPGRLRMLVYTCLAFVGRKFYGPPEGHTQRIPFNMYMKYGARVRKDEAVAMEMVLRHTRIPIPRVLDTLQGSRGTCIIMTRLPGVSFGREQTLYDLSPEQLQDFEDTLRDWFTQLRNILVPPSATISSIAGNACRCYRVSHDHDFGPFQTEEQLQEHLLRSVPKRHHATLRAKLGTLRMRPHRLLFSHGDLHPNNFLLQEGRLTGWIDWECAGWFPEYWDYTNALYLRTGYRLWCEVFTRIFPQYGPELAVEDAFWMVANPW
ncbi:kinase-like protein [Pilatotrama ljubarskyi]|nr:kinase-like protein [Pilatotrama ljubarskyi]